MVIGSFPSFYLKQVVMAHRGETLHSEVACIADLKAQASKNLPPMIRGDPPFVIPRIDLGDLFCSLL